MTGGMVNLRKTKWAVAVLAFAAPVFFAVQAYAQGAAQAVTLESLAAKAGKSRLELGLQPFAPNIALAKIFSERFPNIDVRITQMAVSNFTPRVLAEQKAGIFTWDVYFGQVLSAGSVLAPVGALAKITDYLLLPEVKNPAAWRAPHLLYSPDGQPYIFNSSIALESSLYVNTARLNGVRLDDADDLLDPRLKGRIAIRMADRSGAGAVSLAALYKSKGEAFIRKLLVQPGIAYFENPRQITMSVMRGEKAVAIGGGSSDILGTCKLSGGCGTVVESDIGSVILPRGVFVLKNAPHQAATQLWVNWVLSREGQAAFVREWAKSYPGGAVSMRKDVPPAKGHEVTLPNFNQPGRYLLLGTKEADRITAEAVAVFRSVRDAKR